MGAGSPVIANFFFTRGTCLVRLVRFSLLIRHCATSIGNTSLGPGFLLIPLSFIHFHNPDEERRWRAPPM
jgi:hypothetical protein